MQKNSKISRGLVASAATSWATLGSDWNDKINHVEAKS